MWGYYEYRGGVQHRGGYLEYHGDAQYRGDFMMHVGDIMGTVGEYHEYHGGIS